MNYIKRLQQLLSSHRNSKEVAQENLADLRRYLLSEKFHCGSDLDGYVNIKDVLRYVDRVRGDLNSAEWIE